EVDTMFIGIIARSALIAVGGYRYDVARPLFVALRKPVTAVPVVTIVSVKVPFAAVVVVARAVFSSDSEYAAIVAPLTGVALPIPRSVAVPLNVIMSGAGGASIIIMLSLLPSLL